ncbi:excisionase family DNA-binding protein [Streptomyces lavendulae]|uniref:excisionase family DNA-binding protein n=1 Tax=Streptomyces lavendulae TaxID=1914 RepID=UPI0036E26732
MKFPRLTLHAAPQRPASQPSHTPWWVGAFTTSGRPAVAVIVLVMCAPGEHHLAKLAGWDDRLAWGMAAVLAAYAGIAAAVASARPAGAPGKKSAVVGAFTSLGAAMAAQPVSHAFVTGHLSSEPRAPLWLVISVSCVPPLVFGHLLHLAATPVSRAAAVEEQDAETPSAPRRAAPVPVPVSPWFTAVPAGARMLSIVSGRDETQAETPDPQASEPRLIATREVAGLMGVKDSTVRTWVDRGRIRPVVRDGRGMLFAERDVQALKSA